MSEWGAYLPKSLEVNGREYVIRSDFRAALDVLLAMTDPEITDGADRALTMLQILYEDFDEIPPEDWQEAAEKAVWFLNGGDEERGVKGPKLVDWRQDLRLLFPPINRVLGVETRGVEYLHWFTFIGAYYEIGDCLFAQVVRIRDMKARGRKLDKQDREFYRSNRDLIDIRETATDAEKEILKEWM